MKTPALKVAVQSFKGEVSPNNNTMWIGRVESNVRNPTVKFWANLDNLFKRSNYAKSCMLPSLDRTLPESVISQENNSPLTLYIEFHNFKVFLDVNSPIDQVQP